MLLAFVSSGCARPEPVPSEPTASTEVVSEAQPRDREPIGALEKARRSVTRAMPDHFEHAAKLEEAIIRGDLRAARASAEALALYRPDRYPEPWAAFVLGMRAVAEEATRAEDLDGLARATGAVMGSCGSCHQGLGARVTVQADPEPRASEGDLAALMRRHRWAATRLRAGLVEPSAQAWEAGIEAFAPLPTPSCPGEGGAGSSDAAQGEQDLEILRARFHDALEDGRTAESLDDRAAVYGRLLGTCAGCHTGC